ncbi:MAG: MgtC/SapB family protein [Bacteroidales bacterium]|nr:MgtC/SapB family protein [Bacteroidales bacterium]
MEITDFLLRLLAAMGAGGFVGLEREWSNKDAGLKTNMLVAVGACIYVLISIIINRQSDYQTDITRIIGQIVTGIGFLGAGVILHKGVSIHGLTTAATIWCSAALGCLAGLALFVELAICTVAVLTINLLFEKVENWLEKSRKEFLPEEQKSKKDNK